jgi:beta-N-acetylhexosaminidase
MTARLATALLGLLLAGVLAADAAARGASSTPLPVAELLLVGVPGTEVEGNAEAQALVCDAKVGGVILFEKSVATGAPRNILSAEQLRRFTADLQALARRCTGRSLLIATDNEGGLVTRLSVRAGYLPTPSAQELGAGGDLALTELEARRVGTLMRTAGLNWNLAPVVDVAVNPGNPAVVAPMRTFSADADRVTAHARAFIRGMRAAGVLTNLKHFPGHGSSRVDSHHGFTDVSESANLDVELQPYRALIREGLADSVMPGHMFNLHLDPKHPASLSRATITGLLRGRLGYTGLVVSDDLQMGAVTQRYGVEEAAVLALRAGVDVLLVSGNSPKEEGRAVDRVVAEIRRALADGRLAPAQLRTALRRVAAFRSRASF